MRALAGYLQRACALAGILVLAGACVFAETAPSSTKSTPVTKSKPKTSISTTKSKSVHSRNTASKTTSRKGKRSKKVKVQQKIDTDRTHQIQEALIRQHYLSGEPTGNWDASTEDALRRFQADHGWQNKTVPDSRALIKLGLGPSHDHLLNPESAMTTAVDPPQSTTTPASAPASGPTSTANQPQR